MPQRRRIHPPRVAECRHERVHLAPIALDLDPALAEVDPQPAAQSAARWRLETGRRRRLSRKLAARVRHRPHHRARADHDARLGCRLLAHHVRVAPATPEPLGRPDRLPRRRAGPGRNPAGCPGTRGEVTLHRLAIAPDLRRDPPRAPAQTVEPPRRRHLVRRPRRPSPPAPPCRAGKRPVDPSSRLRLPCRVAGSPMSPPDGFDPVARQPAHHRPGFGPPPRARVRLPGAVPRRRVTPGRCVTRAPHRGPDVVGGVPAALPPSARRW